MRRYAELQVTTHFSFLRGASSADELFATAAALDIDALGVVDCNSLAGIVRAWEAAKATGLAVAPLAHQGEWLLKLGLGERAKALARANPSEAGNIARAIERLTSPEQMGTLFKVLCAHSPGLKPAGF